MSKKKLAVGVDIGGTNLRLGLVDSHGKVVCQKNGSSPTHQDGQALIDLLSQLIPALLADGGTGQVVGVGVGMAGIVSSHRGMVYQSPHFPRLKDFPLQSLLQGSLGLPVVVDNDANQIARGEAALGPGRGGDFLLVTLGTGIGGALVLQGEVYPGTHGFAGEIGHMVIEVEGPACPCGSHGCWERFASASGLLRSMKESLAAMSLRQRARVMASLGVPAETMITPAGLADLAHSGHPWAKDLFVRFGYYLGVGLASLVNVTGIQRIVVGGGLANAWPLFIGSAEGAMKRRTYPRTAQGIKIVRARLGDRAGIIGSALAVLRGPLKGGKKI